MPRTADFDAQEIAEFAKDELQRAVKGNGASIDVSAPFMPELTDKDVKAYAHALTLNEYSWFALAVLAHMRAMASYGFKNIAEARAHDAAFCRKRLFEYAAEIARPNVLEWAALAKLLTEGSHAHLKHDKEWQNRIEAVRTKPFACLIKKHLSLLKQALPQIKTATKALNSLQRRVVAEARESVGEYVAGLIKRLTRLEGALLNELAVAAKLQ